MQRPMPSRTGFSLAEVLVVTSVIALILSFMLPALMRGREAARRIQCVNNLNQLSLALQNYHALHGGFPPGVVDPVGPIRSEPVGLHIGWVRQMLPFIEQTSLSGSVNDGVSVYDPANRTVTATTISSLSCPSDPLPRLGQSSFAGCHHDVEAPIDVDQHGVFFRNSHVRLDDLTDGTSATILVGEKRATPADLGWMSGTRATLRNTGTPLNAPEAGDADPLHVGGFGSYHPGGANFAFGDGSVRFVRQTITPRIYRALGHRDDGELIDRIR